MCRKPRKKLPKLVLNEMPSRQLERVLITLNGTAVRHDRYLDKDYLVVPMVMLTVGVHNGSQGPLFYDHNEIARSAPAWNMKPIVVFHPTINGVGVSACDPRILEKRQVGLIFNTKFDGKLKAEAWLDVAAVKRVDNRILERLERGEMVEVSTGLFTDAEMGEGVWNEEPYIAVVRNFRPDHLAILPDGVGACSIADGAGLLRLNAENPAVQQLVMNERAVDLNEGQGYYILDKDGELYQQNYTVTNGEAVKVGEPVAVTRVYQAVNNEKENSMNKAAFILALIANTAWTENDKDFLEGLDEDKLEKLGPMLNKDGTLKEQPATKGQEERPQEAQAQATTNAQAQAPAQAQPAVAQPQTLNDYIANCPPEVRPIMQQALRAAAARKEQLVGQITANSANTFSKEQLEAMEIGQLEGIAAIAAPTANAQASSAPRTFQGLADAFSAPTPNPVANDEEPLGLPTMNFGKAG